MRSPLVPLNINRQGFDKLGRYQKSAIATTVFLRKNGKILMMRQTKAHRVVGENYVGVGGKSIINTYLETGEEKVATEIVISSMMSGEFGIDTDIDEVATKEVYEEVELLIDKKRLIPVGICDVALVNQKSNEHWTISYFTYDLNTDEDILISSNDEGELVWVDETEILSLPMLPADRVILKNMNPKLRIEAIYNDLEKENIIRVVEAHDNHEFTYVLIPDTNNPNDYEGVTVKATLTGDNKALKELINKSPDMEDELYDTYANKQTINKFYYPEGSNYTSSIPTIQHNR